MGTPTDPNPSGVFTFQHLIGSPRLGLEATDTVTVIEKDPDTRRALLEVTLSSREDVQVFAPYQDASSITGYWIPLEGPHDTFVPADWFSLSGGTIGAGFYLSPTGPDTGSKEIVALVGSGFFGDVFFCGFQVRIGDYADELIKQIEDAGYPCEMIVRRSENREFVTSMIDMDSQMKLYVTNNMVDQVFTWLR